MERRRLSGSTVSCRQCRRTPRRVTGYLKRCSACIHSKKNTLEMSPAAPSTQWYVLHMRYSVMWCLRWTTGGGGAGRGWNGFSVEDGAQCDRRGQSWTRRGRWGGWELEGVLGGGRCAVRWEIKGWAGTSTDRVLTVAGRPAGSAGRSVVSGGRCGGQAGRPAGRRRPGTGLNNTTLPSSNPRRRLCSLLPWRAGCSEPGPAHSFPARNQNFYGRRYYRTAATVQLLRKPPYDE